jgi:hypothetical protein
MGMVFLIFFFCFLLPAPKECTKPPLVAFLPFLFPFEALANTRGGEEEKLVLSFLLPWTASALNGAKGRTALRMGFKKEMYEYYSYIRRRESCILGRLPEMLADALSSFLLLFRRGG